MQLQALMLLGCLSVVSALNLGFYDTHGLEKRHTASDVCGRNKAGKIFPHNAHGCVECGHNSAGKLLFLTYAKTCETKCPTGFVANHKTRKCDRTHVVSPWSSHHAAGHKSSGGHTSGHTDTNLCGNNLAGKAFPHTAKGCVECGHTSAKVALFLTASNTCVTKCPSGFLGKNRKCTPVSHHTSSKSPAFTQVTRTSTGNIVSQGHPATTSTDAPAATTTDPTTAALIESTSSYQLSINPRVFCAVLGRLSCVPLLGSIHIAHRSFWIVLQRRISGFFVCLCLDVHGCVGLALTISVSVLGLFLHRSFDVRELLFTFDQLCVSDFLNFYSYGLAGYCTPDPDANSVLGCRPAAVASDCSTSSCSFGLTGAAGEIVPAPSSATTVSADVIGACSSSTFCAVTVTFSVTSSTLIQLTITATSTTIRTIDDGVTTLVYDTASEASVDIQKRSVSTGTVTTSSGPAGVALNYVPSTSFSYPLYLKHCGVVVVPLFSHCYLVVPLVSHCYLVVRVFSQCYLVVFDISRRSDLNHFHRNRLKCRTTDIVDVKYRTHFVVDVLNNPRRDVFNHCCFDDDDDGNHDHNCSTGALTEDMHIQTWAITLAACLSAVNALGGDPHTGATLAKRRSKKVAGPCGVNEAGKNFPHSAAKLCTKCGHSAAGVELYLTPAKHCFSKCPPGYVGDHKVKDCTGNFHQLCHPHECQRLALDWSPSTSDPSVAFTTSVAAESSAGTINAEPITVTYYPSSSSSESITSASDRDHVPGCQFICKRSFSLGVDHGIKCACLIVVGCPNRVRFSCYVCPYTDNAGVLLGPGSNVILDNRLFCSYPQQTGEDAFGYYCLYGQEEGGLNYDYDSGFCPNEARDGDVC
ncbi:hypothetical protein RQP46_009441 [Phenoliferia psychrophenolica]